MWRKFFKIGLAIVLLIVALGIVIDKTHPIILGWLSGTARIIGKPIKATVYSDGVVNNDIKVYLVDNAYWNGDKTNDYLVSLKEYDKYGMLKFINIDLKEKWIGRPVGTSKDCYEIINGYLFQSEVGNHFVDFKNDMKGFDFDPKLRYQDKQIKFYLPPHQLKFSSITVDLH